MLKYKGVVDGALEVSDMLMDRAYSDPCWVKTGIRAGGKKAVKCGPGYELDLLGNYCYRKCKPGWKPIANSCY